MRIDAGNRHDEVDGRVGGDGGGRGVRFRRGGGGEAVRGDRGFRGGDAGVQESVDAVFGLAAWGEEVGEVGSAFFFDPG